MASRNIVYIREFDKFDSMGNSICRNTGCQNLVKYPFRKYCSKGCSKQFEKWYYHNFYWERVRSDIFKRDNYTCQICRKKYPYTYRKKFARSKRLECDHIIPRSLYKELGFRFDSLDNKIKTITEFLHSHDNLRTLCKECHKGVTKEYLQCPTDLYLKNKNLTHV
ncbi:MAG: HNH endonuclease [Thaumarchaeota archaeon]|nr:MAG: HNH endonuclease [Nitrososphaerota archaeon]